MRRDILLLFLIAVMTTIAVLDYVFPSNALNLAVIPGIPIVLISYLAVLVYETFKANRKWDDYNRRLRLEGREPRYIDETIEIPGQGEKQYSVVFHGKREGIDIQTSSDQPLVVQIKERSSDLEQWAIQASSLNARQASLKFVAKRAGMCSVSISNNNEVHATVKVIVHYFAPRD